MCGPFFMAHPPFEILNYKTISTDTFVCSSVAKSQCSSSSIHSSEFHHVNNFKGSFNNHVDKMRGEGSSQMSTNMMTVVEFHSEAGEIQFVFAPQ